MQVTEGIYAKLEGKWIKIRKSRCQFMAMTLYIVGVLIISIGALIGFTSNGSGIVILASSIPGGVFFLALGKIIDVLESIERKLPEPVRNSLQSIEYKVVSSDFKVYDSEQETYRFMKLDGNDFIQARVFKHYISIAENAFLFKLPNKKEAKLFVIDAYQPSADLFMKDNIAFVRLAYFDIQATLAGGQIVLSYKQTSLAAE
jgi:hypothetical protein